MEDCLIVVDMQNDFISGVLGSEEAQRIVPNVCNKIKEYKDAGKPVFYTMDLHSNERNEYSRAYDDLQEGKNIPLHCVYGTEGFSLHRDIRQFVEQATDTFFKYTFGYPDWGEEAEIFCQFNSIEIIGLCTDICVISNALMLRSIYPEHKITVDASCCAGSTPYLHTCALAVMESCCINIVVS